MSSNVQVLVAAAQCWHCARMPSLAFVGHFHPNQATDIRPPAPPFALHHGPSSRLPPITTSSCRSVGALASYRREPEEENDDDVVLAVFSKIGKALSTPTPGLKSLPIVYPTALLSAIIILPLPTALLLITFFVGYSILGRQVVGGVEEEQTSNKLEFAALIASIPSAVLLSPAGLFGSSTLFNMNIGQGLALGFALVALALVAATIAEAAPSQDEKLLDEWDDKFDNRD